MLYTAAVEAILVVFVTLLRCYATFKNIKKKRFYMKYTTTEQQKMWDLLTSTDHNNNIWTAKQVLAELGRRHLERASMNITTKVIHK
jgi:hypothetical protein